MRKLTAYEAKRVAQIRAKLDPDKTPRPPRQGDYLDDVPWLLALVGSMVIS